MQRFHEKNRKFFCFSDARSNRDEQGSRDRDKATKDQQREIANCTVSVVQCQYT